MRGVNSEPKYVYGMVDPRDGVVRYVGASGNPVKRFRQHLAGHDNTAAETVAWIGELADQGLRPDLRLFTTEPITDWRSVERRVQDQHGAGLVDRHGRGRAINRAYSREDIGAALKNARQSAGIPPGQAAAMLFTTPATISRWESGARSPSVVELIRVANVYGTTLTDLLPTEGGSSGEGKRSRGAKEDLAQARKGKRRDN